MSKNYCIYIIFNTYNGKIYVGKTNNNKKRWDAHIYTASSVNDINKFAIHRAIQKYGIQSFVFTVIQEFEYENDCLMAEKYWIKFFDSKGKNGYNLTDGGEGCSGRTVSELTRKKISEANKGHTRSRGLKHSDETKIKMSNSKKGNKINLGRKHTEETKLKISKKHKGKKISEKQKEDISKALIGRFVGEQNPFYGQKHSNETKIKMSGENNGMARLKINDVLDIRNNFATGNYSRKYLADKYHISERYVGDIINMKRWKNIK